LAISQLNRAVESRVDRRPILSDLRDAGSIEDDADLVLLNYVDSFYNKDSREPDVLETIVVKNRHGLCGTIKNKYNPATGGLLPLVVKSN
jgi:replicative DNA helicase